MFGDRTGDALGAMIPPIANDVRMLVEACVHLRNNSIEPETLRRLVADAGVDLTAALRDVHEWAKLTGQPNEFPPHLIELANAFALGLEPIAERRR
jgi:hypothetical protein